MMDKSLRWILLAASMVLVFWIRVLPFSLPITEPWAEDSAWRSVRQRVAQDAGSTHAPAKTQSELEIRARQWVERHAAAFERDLALKSRELKAEMQFEGEDGRQYVYLGDFDSYLWLRNARTYLRKGTTCDAIVNGECRNTFNYAPVGSSVIYDRQLHTAAIVALHRLATFLEPRFPLSASASLVPVVVGVLGVIPAFFIGARLAGNLGGLFAALLISLQPNFLIRSIGSDNDVWNVVLPLFMTWATMAGMATTKRRYRIACGALVGLVAAMHAAAWRGWFFTYAIIFFSLFANILIEGARFVLREHSYRLWRSHQVRSLALLAAVFYGSVWFFTSLIGTGDDYFAIPFDVLMEITGVRSQPGSGGIDWPHGLKTVLELARPGLDGIINSAGGILFLFAGLCGLVLLLLPRAQWGWHHRATLLCALLIDVYVLFTADTGGALTVLLLSLPLAVALLISLCDRGISRDPEAGAAVLVVLWFMSTLYVAYGGLRYIELMGAPVGLATAVAVSRLYERLRNGLRGATLWKRLTVQTAYSSAALLVLSHPVQLGYGAAAGYTPAMNDAWWDTLEEIRRKSGPDAIVNTWWDYGYWVAYVSERRVSQDGSSLLSHVPHWFGKALVTPSERQSVGLLQMLNCGSDAAPLPEGEQSAYGKLLRAGKKQIEAYAIVEQLANLDEAAARIYLEEQGITGAEEASILESTHCKPPEAFLITTSSLLRAPSAWMQLGLWHPRRSHMASAAQRLPRTRAVADWVQRFGISEEKADTLYSEASLLASQGRLDDFTRAQPGYLSTWFPCAVTSEQPEVLVCQAEKEIGGTPGPREFIYNAASPETARIRNQTLAVASGGITPGMLLVATEKGIRKIEPESPTRAQLGVLVDVPGQRVVFGTPELLRSTLAHLMLLDGRYATRYEKFAERTSHTGERIVVWKIRWEAEKSPQ